jgi:group I intron endonuclease
MSTIYRATNIVNGKSYIGFDSSWPRRKREHLRISRNPAHKAFHNIFHRAIRKYGTGNFKWEIIYESENSKHTLDVMESRLIQEINTHFIYGNGYNMTLGGEGTLGRTYKPHSKKTKSIRSIAMKNSPTAIAHRAKLNSTKISCPHCRKTGDLGNMKRHHFENCSSSSNHIS